MIARMVPHPLVYEGDKIIIVLMEVTELKGRFLGRGNLME